MRTIVDRGWSGTQHELTHFKPFVCYYVWETATQNKLEEPPTSAYRWNMLFNSSLSDSEPLAVEEIELNSQFHYEWSFNDRKNFILSLISYRVMLLVAFSNDVFISISNGSRNGPSTSSSTIASASRVHAVERSEMTTSLSPTILFSSSSRESSARFSFLSFQQSESFAESFCWKASQS
jgi:hypothetical protein